jgi:hypothetical protein
VLSSVKSIGRPNSVSRRAKRKVSTFYCGSASSNTVSLWYFFPGEWTSGPLSTVLPIVHVSKLQSFPAYKLLTEIWRPHGGEYEECRVVYLLPLYQLFNPIHTGGRTPWTRDQPLAKSLPTHRTKQTQNKRTETSMPRVWFEPTIPLFERVKTARPLWSAAGNISLSIKY